MLVFVMDIKSQHVPPARTLSRPPPSNTHLRLKVTSGSAGLCNTYCTPPGNVVGERHNSTRNNEERGYIGEGSALRSRK